MKKVTGWITSDKQFFTDIEIAKSHEVIAKQKIGIENLIKRKFEGAYQNHGIISQLVNFIYENRDELIDFLDDGFISTQVEESIYE